MKTSTILWAVAGVVVLGAIAWAGISYPKISQMVGSSSATGSTFDTAKYAAITEALTVGATSTSILNSGPDRYVDQVRIGCNSIGTSQTAFTGTGLANLQVTIATTSTSAPAAKPTSTAFAAIGTINIATATPTNVLASTTQVIATSTLASIWHTGEYMSFWWNATNTAVCTVGVSYFGS